MIIFSHKDDKSEHLKLALLKLNIRAEALKSRHPVLAPFNLFNYILKGNKIKVYVFRYLNDSNSLFLAILRVISEYMIIVLSKLFNFEIWWLCHNVDKETNMFYPKLTNIRRNNVVRNSKYIFTTNELLIDKAKSMFKNKKIDSLSLGYIAQGINNLKKDPQIEENLKKWLTSQSNKFDNNVKFIFCIGSPAQKSLHFNLVKNFIEELNNQSKDYKWFAIVIGSKTFESDYIYNIPYKISINIDIVKKYADYYYRIIDDFSISYTIYEASVYKIPIITENFGILPEILKKYNIGIVLHDYNNIEVEINKFSQQNAGYESFLKDNNWDIAAKKIQKYYNLINDPTHHK